MEFGGGGNRTDGLGGLGGSGPISPDFPGLRGTSDLHASPSASTVPRQLEVNVVKAKVFMSYDEIR